MHVYFLTALLLLTSAVFAAPNVVVTTAPPEPTKKCPSLKKSPPNPKVCGSHGKLAAPVYYNSQQRPARLPSLEACTNKCLKNVACQSFYFNHTNHACGILGRTLEAQHYKPGKSGPAVFYDRDCYDTCPQVPAKPTTMITTGASTDPTPGPTVMAGAVPYPVQPQPSEVSAAKTKQFLYGSVDTSSNVFYAITDLTAADGLDFVALDSFIPFISSIACGNEISITLNNSDAFDIAKSQWPSNFFLITSGPNYCGNGSDRTAYNASNPSFDSQSTTVTVEVVPIDMEDAIGGVAVDYGVASTNSSSKVKRDLQSAINAIATFFGGDQHGSLSVTISPYTFCDFDQDDYQCENSFVGFSGIVDCDSTQTNSACGFYGTFTFGGSFDCSNPIIGHCKSAAITMSLSQASLVSIFKIESGQNFDFNQQFIVATLDVYSYVIPHVVDIELALNLIVDIDFQTDGNIILGGIGGNATFPDFTASIDLFNPSASTGGAFGNPSFVSGTPYVEGYISKEVSFSIWTGPQLDASFSITAVPDLNFDAYVEIMSPQFTVQFQEADPASCGSNPLGDPVFDVDMTLDEAMVAGVSGPGVPSNYQAVTVLGPYTQNLYSSCFIA